MTDKPKRGFALVKPERQREIASQGGKKAHALGKAHQWTSEEASIAGKKSHETGRAHVFTPEEARAAGIKGAQRKRQRRPFTSEEAKIAGSKGGIAGAKSKALKYLAQLEREETPDGQ